MKDCVTEIQFEDLLKVKLGEHYERALMLFKQYEKRLSWDVTNVLCHAVDKGKVADVLVEFEKHWEKHLQFHHPELRGAVEDRLLGVNKTRTMFFHVCQNILQLPA